MSSQFFGPSGPKKPSTIFARGSYSQPCEAKTPSMNSRPKPS
jgi:hypothetical protein